MNKQEKNLKAVSTEVNEENVEITQVTANGNVVIHPVTKAQNVKYKNSNLHDVLENKLTLDGDSEQNFNFIENKVVQDGLVYKQYNNENFSVSVESDFTLIVDYKNISQVGNAYCFSINKYGLFCHSSSRIGYCDNLSDEALNIKYVPDNGIRLELFNPRPKLVLKQSSNTLTLTVNNKTVIIPTTIRNNILNYAISGQVDNRAFNGEINGVLFYNRSLTQQEIQHNLSVLNNSPSIKELHTTDAEGKTSILKLTSDEDHVEMATGRTLREEYMGVLKTMGKEFVSADGSPITVNNGIEARLISAEIKGQTVKNEILNYGRTDNLYWSNATASCISYSDTYYSLINSTYLVLRGAREGVVSPDIDLSKNYTFLLDIKENPLESFTLITHSSEQVTIEKGFTGIKKFTGKLKTDYQTLISASNTITASESPFVFRFMFVEGDGSNVDSFFSGLSSTQAIINNNGQSYPIYEPTIQGKTRILNGQLVSLEPSDPTLLNLDSVQDVYDEVNLSMKQLTKKIGDMTLNGSESWIWSAVDSSKNIGYVSLSLGQIAPNQNTSILTLNNLFTDIDGDGGHGRRKEGLCLTDGKYLRIMYKDGDVRFSNLSTFKQYLADNNLRVKYVLNQPMTQQLTEEQARAYDTHKKVISLPFAEDKVTLNEDGSATWVNASTEKVFNGSENWSISIPTSDYDKPIARFLLASTGLICDTSKMFSPNTETITGALSYDTSVGIWGMKNESLYVCIKKETIGANITDNTGYVLQPLFKEWLSKNNLTVLGQSVSPTTTPIPKELVPTIRTNKTNLLEAGGAVKPSSFKVTLPVDRIAEIEARLQALESTTVDVVLNK